jgi:hypothetical protein
MSLFCDESDLISESDVEQKLVWPMLTGAVPAGFGYSPAEIRTKNDIRKLVIGKGAEEKLYYPDYVIIFAGLPLIIVEVKKPGESIAEAMREARLYAAELNALFPSGLNPCKRILVTNGGKIVSGPSDTVERDCSVLFQEIDPANLKYAGLVERLCRETNLRAATPLLSRFKGKSYHRPATLLGGKSVRDEEIGHNTFGATLALEYRHLFNPRTYEDRAFIAKHAYITSKRRERYAEPIDTVIRAAIPPSIAHAKTLKSSSAPAEMIDKLRQAKDLEREVLLLVGSVGSGKTTFVDHLREVALPKDVRDSTVWVRLNLNDAPLDQQIYSWVTDGIITGLKSSMPETDFDEPALLLKVHGVELNRFKKALFLLDPASNEYKVRVTDKLISLQGDAMQTAQALARFVCGDRGKALILVFDNCDKQKRDEQLLMFQVAQWVRDQFRCLVFLPLRDVTYDNHRQSPPLDTALKDLVFRIEPPLFSEVLKRRILLAFDQMKSESSAVILSYYLPNGMKVEYAKTDQSLYLASILKSIFEYDRFIRRIISGLAGRDVRRAMEIFLEFCTSAHIEESEIFKIRHANGDYTLPFHLVSRVLLRMNRRFYDGDQSYLKNLFQCFPRDARPNHFTRVQIMQWLRARMRQPGPTGVRGYHKASAIIADLVPRGHDTNRIRADLLYFVKAGCVVAEHQGIDSVSDDDLVTLSPSGHVHLMLVENLDYLAACAEDIWFDKLEIAQRISGRIGRHGAHGHYMLKTTLLNANELINYLLAAEAEDPTRTAGYLNSAPDELKPLLSAIHESVLIERREQGYGKNWDGAAARYRKGQSFEGIVATIKDFGILVELEPGVVGLVSKAAIQTRTGKPLPAIMRGARIKVAVVSVLEHEFRMELELQ